MADLLRRAGLQRVDFLSVDVEGAEERVLQTTNLSEVQMVLIEMDGTSALRDARKHRHMLLSGFKPSHVRVHNSGVYISERARLQPGCEWHSSRAARGEDLLLLPSLLAVSNDRGEGTFVDEAPNPLAAVVRTCFGWREADEHSSAAVELLSTTASKLPSRERALRTRGFKMAVVAWRSDGDERASAELLTNHSYRQVRRLHMVNAALWSRPDVFSHREFGHK